MFKCPGCKLQRTQVQAVLGVVHLQGVLLELVDYNTIEPYYKIPCILNRSYCLDTTFLPS